MDKDFTNKVQINKSGSPPGILQQRDEDYGINIEHLFY